MIRITLVYLTLATAAYSQNRVAGTYYYDSPFRYATLILKNDNTFEYSAGIPIRGTWTLKNDTLFIKSYDDIPRMRVDESYDSSVTGIDIILYDSLQGYISWPTKFIFDKTDIIHAIGSDLDSVFHLKPTRNQFESLEFDIFRHNFSYEPKDRHSNKFKIRLRLPESLFAGQLNMIFKFSNDYLICIFEGTEGECVFKRKSD